MLLDHSIVINTEKSSGGRYTINGWIKCPVGTRALLRFLTKGTEDDSVEGLHWGVTGGWYKYLPATGDREYFQISATFDEEIHGDPEIRVERWFGDGEIELFLEQDKWQPKILFWGDDDAYELLLNSSVGLIERFPLSSCLITAAEPKSSSLRERLEPSVRGSDSDLELMTDIDKSAFEMLSQKHFDAIIIDLMSLRLPIIRTSGTHIQCTSGWDPRGVDSVDTVMVCPDSKEYSEVLRRSLRTLLTVVRPRPVVLQVQKRSQSGTEGEYKPLIAALHSESDGIKPSDFVFYELPAEEICQSRDKGFEPVDLGDLLAAQMINVDSFMMERELASKKVVISSPVHIDNLEYISLENLPSEFVIEIDIIAPLEYRERNLLLTLELEDTNGEPIDSSLSQFSIWRSKIKGVDYFKYFPAIQGSAGAEFEVKLPENIRCTAIGVKQIRNQGDVFVTRVEIQSDESLDDAVTRKPE